ncbi:MAG: apolipoprotein N-acyltransferase [Candidatus Omnitrophica bacterium]|nr:apolipoprotein N-acyltransferase [Candidatus Omnitrophota bacterium]
MKAAALSIFSAILLSISFPKIDLEFLAWFAFVPFFFATESKSVLETFWLSAVTGFTFFFGLLYWVGRVTWAGAIVLVLYCSLYFALFGLGTKFLRRHSILWIPPLWVFLEFLRSTLFTGFGWGLLGYSQWRMLPLIQVADLTGAYGVSFLVMLANGCLYELLREGRKRRKDIFFSIVLFLLLFSGSFFYGRKQITSSVSPSTLRASVIQGNIPQDLKWDRSVQDLVMKKYERLTEWVALNHPDVIFWPETAVPGFLPDEKDLWERLLSLSQKSETYLLVGAPWVEKGRTYNSALFLRKGEVLQRYDKLHLVPFGEFIPFEENFPILREWIVTGDFHPGKEETVFRHPKGTFSTLICFEDIFPPLVRRLAKESDFLVNVTNDAWFGKSGAPFQHAQASCFRAIENRRTVLRVTNTGYTSLIGPTGEILRHLERGGETLFVTASQTWDVPLSQKETFYSRHGDLFAWFCTIATVLGLGLALLMRLLPEKRKPTRIQTS